MGRALRQAAGGEVYHVMNRRVLRLPLFDDDGDYLALLKLLTEALQRPDRPEFFGFCLMPNHWHLLLRPQRNGELSRWMQWLSVTHTHRWHKHHQTAGTGPVYQGRFKSFPVQADEHFLAVLRYIERNALRASLVMRAEHWRYSSLALRCRRPASDVEALLCSLLAQWPVERPRNWLHRVNQAETAAELAALRHSATRGTPFGHTTWQTPTAQRLGIPQTLRPRGRPRKP